MSEWISVKEKLPQIEQHVLVYVSTLHEIDGKESTINTIEVDFINMINGEWSENDPTYYAGEVTHWQPLPDPPKKQA